MKNLTIKIIGLMALSLFIFSNTIAQTNGNAIVGEWFTQNKDARFRIYKQNDKYYGKLIWGTGKDTIDTKNPDLKYRTRKTVGSILLKEFVFDGNETWQDGTIYDPREGKTYACKLTLTDDRKLKVRGYVGISLFGRTELWTRAN